MVPVIDQFYLNEIRGTTDSEHVFAYLLSLWRRHPDDQLIDLVARGLSQVVKWSTEVDSTANVSLNIVLTDGQRLVGSRLGRSLWHLQRERIFDCEICDRPHVHHDFSEHYRSVEIASEPITDENWHELSDGTIYEMDEDFYLLTRSL